MAKQDRLSPKWGPWPAVGVEHISPILRSYGFSNVLTDFEDGLFWWAKPCTELTQLLFAINPNTSPLQNHCRFSGGIFIESRVIPVFLETVGWDIGCAKWTEARSAYISLVYLPLAWLVRRTHPASKRYFWDVDIANAALSLAAFDAELRECVFPVLSSLTEDRSVIQFVRDIDSFSGGQRGGPPSHPSQSLQVSILYFRLGEIAQALQCLDEYSTLKSAYLHRRYVEVGDRVRLADEIVTLARNVSTVRNHFLTSLAP